MVQKFSDAQIRRMLVFDPIEHVETALGSLEERDVGLTALAVGMLHNEAKTKLLKDINDTHFGMTVAEAIQLFTTNGFEQVLDLPFVRDHDGETITEYLYVFVDKVRGILLKFDTYGDAINSGNAYYCIEHKLGITNPSLRTTSSGGYRLIYKNPDRYCWVGNHDCREALLFNLKQIETEWTFMPQWPNGHNQFLWLLHYVDTKDSHYNRNACYDYDAITAERVAMLPKWVQTMINVG